MIILKEVKHYPDTNSVEATWVDEIEPEGVEFITVGEDVDEQVIPAVEVQVRCHSYADAQMDMLRADLGDDAATYAALIALVESNIKPPNAPTLQEQLARFEAILDAHLDATAQSHRYNDRFTFALRAGYSGPFQAEAIAFATWMDSCNLQAYTALQEIVAGTQPMPTEAEFKAALPAFVYPAGA